MPGVSITKIISSVIAQLAKGIPIWKISMPSCVHTDLSGLEALQTIIFHNKAVLERYSQINSTEDPLERLALCLSCIVDPHTTFFTDKPFNPILGEFLRYEADGYVFNAEQISHHPPIVAVEIIGPEFKLHAPYGVVIDGFKGVKPGIMNLDVCFPDQLIRLETKSGIVMEWENVGYRLHNFLTSERAVEYHGKLVIVDRKSGLSFDGIISRNLEISGSIKKDGKVIHKIKGNVRDGLYINQKLWMQPLPYEKLSLHVREQDSRHHLFSKNVWKMVMQEMRKEPKDFSAADIEKAKIEEKQRLLVKEGIHNEFHLKLSTFQI